MMSPASRFGTEDKVAYPDRTRLGKIKLNEALDRSPVSEQECAVGCSTVCSVGEICYYKEKNFASLIAVNGPFLQLMFSWRSRLGQKWGRGEVGTGSRAVWATACFKKRGELPFPEGRLTTYFSNGDLVRRDRDPFNEFEQLFFEAPKS